MEIEKDDILKDDFLRDFMQSLPEDVPSENFVSNVMSGLVPIKEEVTANRTVIYFLKTVLPYAAVVLAILLFVFTSDLPFLSYIPGKESFINAFLPYFTSFSNSFRFLFGNTKDLSLPVMVAIAAGLFFIIDKLFTRKIVHQTSF